MRRLFPQSNGRSGLAWESRAIIEGLECRTLLASGTLESANLLNRDIPDDGGPGNQVISQVVTAGAPENAVITNVRIHYTVLHGDCTDLKVWVTTPEASAWLRRDLWYREVSSAYKALNRVENDAQTWNGLSPNRRWTLAVDDLSFTNVGHIEYFSIVVDWATPDALPNLRPRTPNGWADSIVVATQAGTSTDALQIFENQNVLIDWAFGNAGPVGLSEPVIAALYLDDRLLFSEQAPSTAGGTKSVRDVSLGKLSPGTHTIKLVCDPHRKIAESNESDNTYIKTVTVLRRAVPKTPADLIATDGTETGVRLDWTASPFAVSYKVRRSTSSDPSTARKVGTCFDNHWTDTTAKADQVYWYWVKAVNSSGASALSLADSGWTSRGRVENDNFATPYAISGTSATIVSYNGAATSEAQEPQHAGQAGGKSLWWLWTAPYTGSVAIDTLGSDFDTLLAVYQGTELSALTSLAGRSSDDVGAARFSRVEFRAVQGESYLLAVDGFAGAAGTVRLNLKQKPLKPPMLTSTRTAAGVVLSWEPGPDLPPGTGYELWSGASSDRSRASAVQTAQTYRYVAPSTDQWYWIRPVGGRRFSAPVCVPAVPASTGNDHFANRHILAGDFARVVSRLDGASREAAEPSSVSAPSLWWSWTAPRSGAASLDVSGSYTQLGVYTGQALDRLALVAGGSNSLSFTATAGVTYQLAVYGRGAFVMNLGLAALPAPAGVSATDETGGGVSITWQPSAGATEYEVIRGENDATGVEIARVSSSTLSYRDITARAGTQYWYWIRAHNAVGRSGWSNSDQGSTPAYPHNDHFVQAKPLTGEFPSVTANNSGASKVPGEPEHAGNAGGHSLWWSWTAPRSELVTLYASGTGVGCLLAIYTGDTIGALTPVAASDFSYVSFEAIGGTTYRIAVDGYEGRSGPFTLARSYYYFWADQLESTAEGVRLSFRGNNDYQVWRSSTADFTTATYLGTSTYNQFIDTLANPDSSDVYWLKSPLESSGHIVGRGAIYRNTMTVRRGEQDRREWAWVAPCDAEATLEAVGRPNRYVSVHTDAAPNAPALASGNGIIRFRAFKGVTYWVPSRNSDSLYQLNATPIETPAPVGTVVAENGTSTGGVRVSWEGSPLRCYEVWRSTTQSLATAINLTPIAMRGTTFVDTTARPGVPYCYWVRENDTAGVGDFSTFDWGYAAFRPVNDTVQGAKALSGFPDTVQGTTVGASASEMERNTIANCAYSVWYKWQPQSTGTVVAKVSGSEYWGEAFRVFTGESSSALRPLNTAFDAAAGATYWFFIGTSNERSFTLTIKPVPEAPAAPVFRWPEIGTTVQLAWTCEYGSSFEVWRGTTEDRSLASMIGTSFERRYEDTTAVPDQQYFYWVRATNQWGTSFFSEPKQAFCTRPPANDNFADRAVITSLPASSSAVVSLATTEPGEPNDIRSAHTAWWEWTATFTGTIALTGYSYVHVYTGSAIDTLVRQAQLSSGRTAAIEVTAGTTYQICGAEYGMSLEISQVTSLPRAPQDLHSISGLIRGVQLRWSSDAAASSYEVWRVMGEDFSAASLLNDAPIFTPEFWDTTAEPNRRYTYWVRAYNSLGFSGFSAPVQGSRSPVSNEDFGSRELINGTHFSTEVMFSRDGGEPVFSRWWSWTAPQTGILRLVMDSPTCGRQDGIRVYSGESLETLVPVAEVVDYDWFDSDWDLNKRCEMALEVQAGQTYQINVNAEFGPFTLDLEY